MNIEETLQKANDGQRTSNPTYFRKKFGVEILEKWSDIWKQYQEEGLVTVDGDRIELTRDGLLRADGLLPPFFEPEFQGVRYT